MQVVPGGADHLLPGQQEEAGAQQPGAGQAGVFLQLRGHAHDGEPPAAHPPLHRRLHRPPVPAPGKMAPVVLCKSLGQVLSPKAISA